MGLPQKPPGRKFLLPAGGIALLAFLLAWVLTHLGAGIGGGGGTASQDTSATTHSPATQAGPPMEVVIQEDRYTVDAKELTLYQIVAMAAASPSVKIVSGPDSRMGAERDLEKALDDAHLSWSLEAEPVSGQ
jgi:hypothetical protein